MLGNDVLMSRALRWAVDEHDLTIEAIKNSKDEHLNDIPLHRWDSLSGCMFRGSQCMVRPTVSKECADKINEAGEGVSPATMVCIYKAIARELTK